MSAIADPVTCQESRLDSLYVETTHDSAKRPDMICALCWEPIEDGSRIVGMLISPRCPRWSSRAWHYEQGRNCFNRKFPTRVPRAPRFTPQVHG